MDCIPLKIDASHYPHLMGSSHAVNVSVAAAHAHLTDFNHHHLLHPYSTHNTTFALNHTNKDGGHHHHHHHINTEQTKSLQELQHEVGELLEFRDLVIETFPDLKQKMASISSSLATSTPLHSAGLVNGVPSVSSVVSVAGSVATLTSCVAVTSRREWEPVISVKQKIGQKEAPQLVPVELSSTATSLTRSRSNSHSGKKEPKSNGVVCGENSSGSVVQDSGFSTETSSSKEGHSASSTNGAVTGVIASNRYSCPEYDNELLNLLNVIHRKSNRLREEVEQLQNYESHHIQQIATNIKNNNEIISEEAATNPSTSRSTSANIALTHKNFREHVERLNRKVIKQLRKERDRLLDLLAQMEAETLTGRIKASKMSDEIRDLMSVKTELENQLKLTIAQKLELNSKIQQLQEQQPQHPQQSKISISHSDTSSQRTFITSSDTTVMYTIKTESQPPKETTMRCKQNTFQPVLLEQQEIPNHSSNYFTESSQNIIRFHQSIGSDTKLNQPQLFSVEHLGRLDGVVSASGGRYTKCGITNSKRVAAILLETNVIELQRHLLILSKQNQILLQKFERANKSKLQLVKRLDKSKEDVEDLRFQLEEKNIELEGTKAQLRLLESRLNSVAPISGTGTNSFPHSQLDFETNRSSASTILMMSRLENIKDLSPTIPPLNQILPLSNTQISTTSIKAMAQISMDNWNACNKELTLQSSNFQIDSNNVGKHNCQSQPQQTECQLQHQQHITSLSNKVQALKKFSGAANKPSKIPLPGSKAAALFSGKSIIGRGFSTGRSPPSVNQSNCSHRSLLSRSTGNLYFRPVSSLKRTDSVQSVRQNNANSSLTTNANRSSIASSIPMPNTSKLATLHCNTPSWRGLPNSPLPKLKRDCVSHGTRYIDNLSRAYTPQNISSNSDNTPTTPLNTCISANSTPVAKAAAGGYLISSTRKVKIRNTAQATPTVRKESPLTSNSFSHRSQIDNRNKSNNIPQTTVNAVPARRFSSASVTAARLATVARQSELNLPGSNLSVCTNTISTNINGNGGGTASDSDSGKVRTLKSTFLGWLNKI